MKSILIGISKVIYSIIIISVFYFSARYFDIVNYARLREFFLYLNIGIGISGVPSINAIYYFKNRNFKDICYIFLFSFIISIALFSILYIYTEFNFLYILIIGVISGILYLLLDALFLSNNKLNYSFLLTIFESFSFIIPIPILYISNGSLLNYMKIFFYISFIKIVIYSIIIYLKSIQYSGINNVKALIKYIFPVYINGFSGILSSRSDKYIVSVFFSKSVFAFYSTGSFELPFIGRFVNGIFHSKSSKLRALMEDLQYDSLKIYLKQILNYLFPFIGMIIILVSVNSKLLIGVLFPKYIDAYIYFFVLLFIAPIRIIPFGFLMNIYGKTKELMYLSIFDALITVNLLFVLIPKFGPIGGIFSFLIATILQVILILCVIKRFFPIYSFILQFLLITVICNVGFMLNELNKFNLINNLIIIIYAMGIYICKKRGIC